jgi:RsiW-degrading membrane proteinase PrsW (M82 family)
MIVFQYVLAILPTLLLAVLIYRADRYEREKWLPLTICFALGLIVTYPVLKIQQATYNLGLDDTSSWPSALFTAFILVSFTEELFKFIALIIFPYRQAFFNDPMDGIVYSVMIGMGFATLENLLYAFQFDIPTTALRGLTAVPVHAICATTMGYYVSKAKFSTDPKKTNLLLAYGLGASILVHGLYDFFILQEIYDWLILLAIVTLMISLVFAARMFKEDQVESSAYWKKKNGEGS